MSNLLPDDSELNPDERAAFAALSAELPVPAGLAPRVAAEVAAAHRAGRTSRQRRVLQLLGGLAATIAIFLAGAWFGRGGARTSPTVETGERYVLLLHEDATFAGGATGSLVAEYRDWAIAWHRRGALELGEKLADGSWLLDQATVSERASPGGDAISGLFVIRAESAQQALEIAGSCPHLRHGGRIELRRIEET
jgi:hypothetical protein